jgi:xanthine dehydrogenase accessory factor
MRNDDFFDKVGALKREGRSFAVATVVARQAPVSAHLGDRAIVYDDGRMEGFVGGACSKEIVRKQALESLRVRRPRLVSIRPEAADTSADAEHITVRMSCASEGAVDVYVEPMVPRPVLVVVGATPVAEALARIAGALDRDVVRVVEAGERRDIEAAEAGVAVTDLESLANVLERSGSEVAVVVASQGHYDEQALEVVLRSARASYVGLVASRKRGAIVRDLLNATGLPGVAAIRSPAGLDLGARTAPEVALSILAEIVQHRPAQAGQPAGAGAADVEREPAPATAVDPVCGMEVVVATAQHKAEVEGTAYYFCCGRCRSQFLKDSQGRLAAP